MYKSDVQIRYTNPIYNLDVQIRWQSLCFKRIEYFDKKSIEFSVRDFSSTGFPDRTVPLGPTIKRGRVLVNAFFFNIILFEFYSFSFE